MAISIDRFSNYSQWVVLVLYGIVGALFAYCISLAMSSPLASFAAVAGYQIIMYIVSISISLSEPS